MNREPVQTVTVDLRCDVTPAIEALNELTAAAERATRALRGLGEALGDGPDVQ
jgi:hypothetical protein